MKPRLLDLFCGAGGCSVGYHRAGFDVVGVDLNPQPNYPYEFHQADALEALSIFWSDYGGTHEFAAIHASPPCQAYTHAKHLGHRGRNDHPQLIEPTRELLIASGLPYVIENVEGSPLVHAATICGSSIGLPIRRHRLFETNWMLMVPPCQHGTWGARQYPGTPRFDGAKPASRIVNQMASGTTHAMLAKAFDIDWIPDTGGRPADALRQAIPPAYTELIGHQLMAHVRQVAA